MSSLPELEPGALLEQRLREAADFAAREQLAEASLEPLSLAEQLAALPDAAREEALALISPRDALHLEHDWRFWARPAQLRPTGAWIVWLILAGRGWGKTRTGAEAVKEAIELDGLRSIGLVGPTLSDVWDQMVFGTDDAPGLLSLFAHYPEASRPRPNRADRKIYFANGAVARIYTAEEPEIRGPNTQLWWCDELAKWPKLQIAWDNIEMCNRAIGRTPPRIIVTTTPRNLQLLKDLLDDPETAFTFGSTFANASNLSPSFIRRMRRKFVGSRLGSQELFGLILGDNPDALFHASVIDAYRHQNPASVPEFARVVVAVDPAISTKRRSDLTGIVVLGVTRDGHVYVLADLTGVDFQRAPEGRDWSELGPIDLSLKWTPADRDHPRKHSPAEWGELAIKAFWHWKADAIVCERNRGGDLVAQNVRGALRALKGPRAVVPIREVVASRGKVTRAEPVAALAEQGRIHVVGALPLLEQEVTEWNPRLDPESPNRLDALVWGAFDLCELGAEETAEVKREQATRAASGVRAANERMSSKSDATADEVLW